MSSRYLHGGVRIDGTGSRRHPLCLQPPFSRRVKPPDEAAAAMRRITGKAKDETLIELQSATDTQPGGNERNASPLPLRESQDHKDVQAYYIKAVTSVLMVTLHELTPTQSYNPIKYNTF